MTSKRRRKTRLTIKICRVYMPSTEQKERMAAKARAYFERTGREYDMRLSSIVYVFPEIAGQYYFELHAGTDSIGGLGMTFIEHNSWTGGRRSRTLEEASNGLFDTEEEARRAAVEALPIYQKKVDEREAKYGC